MAKFYASLFDWKIEPLPDMEYWHIKTVESDAKGMSSKPGGINGGMMKLPVGYEGRAWTDYALVESIKATVALARKLGAMVMKEKTPVPDMGWFAMLIDPQGNPFAIWQMDPNAK